METVTSFQLMQLRGLGFKRVQSKKKYNKLMADIKPKHALDLEGAKHYSAVSTENGMERMFDTIDKANSFHCTVRCRSS